MNTDILNSIPNAATNSHLKPAMHQVKIYSNLISAIESSGNTPTPETITQVSIQIENFIDQILIANKVSLPAEEWQRGTIRSAILPLCVNDIKTTGQVKGSWFSAVCEITTSLKIQHHINYASDPTLIVKMTLVDSITTLSNALNHITNNKKLVISHLVNKVFSDSKELHRTLKVNDKKDSSILFSNLLSNHTKLMVAAIDNSPSINTSLKRYEDNKSLLVSLAPSLSEIIKPAETPPTKTPNFISPSL
jgi:hypothetical protein